MSPASLTNDLKVVRIRRESAAETVWHAHPQSQLYSLTSGIMTVETRHGALVIPKGRVGWIPASHEHRGRAYGTIEGWVAHLSPRLSKSLPMRPCVLQHSDLILAVIRKVMSWDEDAAPCPVADHLIAVLIDEVQAGPEESLKLPFPKDRRLAAIASGLLRDPGNKRGLAQWARWSGISSRSLIRGFKLETGLSFGRWRSLARMFHSFESLSKGMPVCDVALRVGYENPSAFIATFKKLFGLTPTAYFDRSAAKKSPPIKKFSTR